MTAMRAARAVLLAALVAFTALGAFAVLAAEPILAASPSATPVPASPVRGRVLDIFVDPDPVVESFTFIDDDGRELRFVIGDLAPTSFPPIHLFEHVVFGTSIVVGFEVRSDGSLAATDLREIGQAWLDRPLPSDAPPGSTIAVGATIRQGEHASIRVFFRVRPATGAATPIEVIASMDWETHYAADVEVPVGGVGTLDVGIVIEVCPQPGACERYDGLFEVAGVGPPPDSPITLIATAAILPPASEVVAGRPFELDVSLTPNADWEPGAFQFPASLLVDVREARGESIAVVPATLDDPAQGIYRATVTLPNAARYVLQVSTDANDLFATGVATITAAPTPLVPEPGPGLDPLLIAVIGLGAVVLLGLGLFVLREAG
jgi:hypothetical protein